MNCDDFQEDASRFMDRMLDASGQVGLFAHLSSCSDCRSFLASSVRVREVI
ncbi:zf-HC2 domain-containing protein, partial [bacterium]